MKISVIITAHAGGWRRIKQCLDSIRGQSRSADQIILALHGCEDGMMKKVEEYALKHHMSYKLKVHVFAAEYLVTDVYHRTFREAAGDVVLCIDAHCYARYNWIEEMVRTLNEEYLLVGSIVRYKGNLLCRVINGVQRMVRCMGITFIYTQSFCFEKKKASLIRSALVTAHHIMSCCPGTTDPREWFVALLAREGCLKVTRDTSVKCHVGLSTFIPTLRSVASTLIRWHRIRRFISKNPKLRVRVPDR